MPRWVKGQSGNPRGRKATPVERSIKALAERHTNRARKALTDVLKDGDAPHAARVAAARELLDRAYGKAPADVTVRGKVESHIIDLVRGLDKALPDSDTDSADAETMDEEQHTTH